MKLNETVDVEATIEVINMLGQVVYAEKTKTSGGSLISEITLNNVAGGIYYVRVNANNKMLTIRL